MKRLLPGEAQGAVPAGSKPDPNACMLVVGREILVSGEIKSCDCLVVEGTVEASVSCKEIRIAAGGLFKGAASVETAEIFGRFEGELQVSGRLNLHASGEVAAKLRYQQLEIERGGRLSGDIQASGAEMPHEPTFENQRRRA